MLVELHFPPTGRHLATAPPMLQCSEFIILCLFFCPCMMVVGWVVTICRQFNILDTNGSGTISYEAMRMGLANLGTYSDLNYLMRQVSGFFRQRRFRGDMG